MNFCIFRTQSQTNGPISAEIGTHDLQSCCEEISSRRLGWNGCELKNVKTTDFGVEFTGLGVAKLNTDINLAGLISS